MLKYCYLFLAYVCYIIGDVACRINAEWAANLYQLTMNKSYHYDEKIGFVIWKEAHSTKNKNL